MEAWSGQKHLQAPWDPPEDEVEERERVGETEVKRKTLKDELGTLLSLFPHPLGKRQISSGLFSNILVPRNEAKPMAEAEAEETLDRIGRTPFSKILRLQLNQEGLDKPDFKGNFPQMLARPRKRETELLLGEVGPGRGLFSNILSRLDGRQRRASKRAQGGKSLFSHILR